MYLAYIGSVRQLAMEAATEAVKVESQKVRPDRVKPRIFVEPKPENIELDCKAKKEIVWLLRFWARHLFGRIIAAEQQVKVR